MRICWLKNVVKLMKKLLKSESSWKFSWNWGSSFIKSLKNSDEFKKITQNY